MQAYLVFYFKNMYYHSLTITVSILIGKKMIIKDKICLHY